MIDKTPVPARKKNKKSTIPAFAPVPRQCNRFDGWTPERQHGFIAALADTGSVKAAAHAVNMTPEGAYLLRRHPEGGAFRKAWEAALALGVQRLEDIAMERALHGVEVPVYHFGAVVGTRRVYNDRLLMFILRNRAGKRFSADGWQKTDAATQGQLKKLKAQWHKDWEREQAITQAATTNGAGEDFVETLERRHLKWWAGLSPRTRAAYREFRRLEREDGHAPWRDEDAPDIAADYEETFARDRRPPIDRWIEAEAIGDDKLPLDDDDEDHDDLDALDGEAQAEALAAQPHHREVSLKHGWQRAPNDGRAKPWP